MIPEWVLDADISDRAVRLYGILHRHSNKLTRRCKVGRPRLAKRLGVNVKTIDRASDQLERIGAVTCIPEYNDQGQTANVWIVNLNPFGATQMSLDPGVKNVAGGGVKNVAHNESKNLKPPPTPSKEGGVEGRTAAQTVSCPNCKAAPGHACVGARGKSRSSNHAERIAAYPTSGDELAKRRADWEWARTQARIAGEFDVECDHELPVEMCHEQGCRDRVDEIVSRFAHPSAGVR